MISSKEEQPHNDAAVVASYDIFCGRNSDAIRSTGTQRFREIVLTWVPQYAGAPSKFTKSVTVEKVVEAIKADGGRFVQVKNQLDGTAAFVELSSKQARTKVSHALRDMAAGQARRRGSITNMSEARRSSITKKGQATNTLSQEVATRRLSVGPENAFSGIARLQEQRQQQRPSALCHELLELHFDCGESIQTIGTFTEMDTVPKVATQGDEHETNVEEERRLSEDVSVVSLDSAFEKEQHDDDDDDDWWIDALTEDSSFSNRSSLDGVVIHHSIAGVSSRRHTCASATTTTTTTTATSNLLQQLLSQPSIGPLHQQDFAADEDNDDGPPLAEIIF